MGVLGVMGVLCFMLLPMAKLASSRVSGSTDTSLESNGGSFLDTAIAYHRTDFNINLFDVKFIFRVSGSTDTNLESNGGSFLDTAIAYRIDFNINLFDVKFIFRVSGSTDTSLESKGGSFLDTAMAYRIDFNITLYNIKFIINYQYPLRGYFLLQVLFMKHLPPSP